MSAITRRLSPGQLSPAVPTGPRAALPQEGVLALDPERLTTADLRGLAGLLKHDFDNLSQQETLSPTEEVYVQKAVVYGSRALVRTATYRSAHKPRTQAALTSLQDIHLNAMLYHNVMQHSGNERNRERFSTINFGGENGNFPAYVDFATDSNTLGAVLSPFTSHSAPLYDETLDPAVSRMPRHQMERIAGGVLGCLADVTEANGGSTSLDQYLGDTLIQIATSRNAAIDALLAPAEQPPF